MKTIWIDLVMDTGELVRIECPGKFEDECHAAIENAMKRKEWWSPQMFDGCSATFMGLLISRVNMARIVAAL